MDSPSQFARPLSVPLNAHTVAGPEVRYDEVVMTLDELRQAIKERWA